MSTPAQDQIIGVWKLSAIFVDNVEQPIFPCATESTIDFQADGNLTITAYVPDFTSGECTLDGVTNFTWENVGSGNYAVTDDLGEVDTQQIVFEGDTTFYIEEIDDNDTPGDTSDDTLDRMVYQKQ